MRSIWLKEPGGSLGVAKSTTHLTVSLALKDDSGIGGYDLFDALLPKAAVVVGNRGKGLP